MKKLATLLLATSAAMPTLAAQIGHFTTQQIDNIKLHSYQANDALGDMSFIIESANKLVVIEPQAFKANIDELFDYTEALKKPIDKVFVAYHAAGVAAYPEATDSVIAKDLDAFFKTGYGKGMLDHFSGVFKDAIDANVVTFDETLAGESTYMVDGVKYDLVPTMVPSMPGFNIEINDKVLLQHFAPQKGMHMSAFYITSKADLEAILKEAQAAEKDGFKYFVGSHTFSVSNGEDLDFEIAYLTEMKQLLASEKTAAAFEKAMTEAYPNLGGVENLTKVALALYQ